MKTLMYLFVVSILRRGALTKAMGAPRKCVWRDLIPLLTFAFAFGDLFLFPCRLWAYGSVADSIMGWGWCQGQGRVGLAG